MLTELLQVLAVILVGAFVVLRFGTKRRDRRDGRGGGRPDRYDGRDERLR